MGAKTKRYDYAFILAQITLLLVGQPFTKPTVNEPSRRWNVVRRAHRFTQALLVRQGWTVASGWLISKVRFKKLITI